MAVDARKYLVPTHETFWQWKENGEVIAWLDGTTIAFRAEVAGVLRRLAERGLPPFGAIVLLLAATRDNWDEALQESDLRAKVSRGLGADNSEGRALLSQVLAQLQRISQLSPELRSSPVAKETIVEMAFDGLRDRGPVEAAHQVVESLELGLGEEVVLRRGDWRKHDLGAWEILRDLHNLNQGLPRVEEAALRLRLGVGLDALPEPVELELSAAERVRALLAGLKNDPELSGLARLALELMAAVNLPRPLSEPDDMPRGGFSDIANRGSLDRLLLSELAHDDLTLAVRVAVNEALYLRREIPPKTPPQQRTMLLETGIRAWGAPRVFVAAVALALAASIDKRQEVKAYRAQGERIAPVDLTTRQGLIEHLAKLETELHPGEALSAFKLQASQAEIPCEPVLVTTDEVLEDREFQLALAECDLAPLLVVTLNREGRFRLLERTHRGAKLLREASFQLDDLFADSKRIGSTVVARKGADALPAICSVKPFPLLLPHNIDQKRLWHVEGRGTFALTTDRRLMLWTQMNRGARQLSDEVASGALWWSSRNVKPGEPVQAVIGHMSPEGLRRLEIDPASEHCDVQPLAVERGVRSICSHNGGLFAIFPRAVHVLDANTGEFQHSLDIPAGWRHDRDRFFRAGEAWHALSYDGAQGLFVQVVSQREPFPQLVALFDRDGGYGPEGITARGDLYLPAEKRLRRVDHGLSHPAVAAIAADGRHVVLSDARSKVNMLVNVHTLGVFRCSGDPQVAAEIYLRDIHPFSLRNRFSHIFVDEKGVLTLTSKKNRQLAIDYDPAGDTIRLRRNDDCGVSRQKRTFKEVKMPAQVGYRLTVATWDDGSQAFLDTRGLLHLKSSDPQAVPETTLALYDGELSGWCADGRVWGWHYFLGDQPSADKREVFNSTIRAFAERIP